MQVQQLGTDNLKAVLAFILLTVSMIVDLFKNFQYTKALGLAFHIGENLDILDTGKVALAEFRDLSVEESQDVAVFLGREFDIENDDLEDRIERGINLLPKGYQLLKTNIAYYEEIRQFVADWKQPEPDAIPRLESALRKIDLQKVRRELPVAA